MKTILFVCTGNTCRSPMAEIIFTIKARKAGLDYTAESAGVSVLTPMPASHNAAIAVERRGGSLAGHISRPVTETLLEKCECALCMTNAQARMLLDRFPEYKDKIAMFSRCDISDPFGGDEYDYERTAQEIDEASDVLVERIKAYET